jgi:hypothetical protein
METDPNTDTPEPQLTADPEPLDAVAPAMDLGRAGTIPDLEHVSETHRRTARDHAAALEAVVTAYREGCEAVRVDRDLSYEGKRHRRAQLAEATARQLDALEERRFNGSSIASLTGELAKAEQAALFINRLRSLYTPPSAERAVNALFKLETRTWLRTLTPEERWSTALDAVSTADHNTLLALIEAPAAMRLLPAERMDELDALHLRTHCAELAERIRELRLMVSHLSWNAGQARAALTRG